MSGRPLDVLEEALEAVVTVRLKDGSARSGLLSGYDQHMNVVLEPHEASGGDEAVEDTTIIRGDNVVSINL
ncbi:LSM domain-containing protein [Halobaculum sp. MBLA0143]|uniref:LSM domain-containing protein n=1 Tax=Halobaculum sp. MBLA0143 TaxID=3079933 RepID=UPI003524B26C